jgi:oxygen-dependent protoporphyrinogen oxidase
VPGLPLSFSADAVVLCTPAVESARLLGRLAPEAARRLATIRSVSTGTVSLAYEGDVLPAAARGFGLVIPTSERRPVNAVTCSSVKFDGRAPDGCTLLRVFFGGSRSPQTFALPDDEIVDVARRQLADLLDVHGTPLFTRLDRWPEAQPQYDVGHLDLVAEIESSLPPALWVTGAACRGVGIPDCVRQGRDTAAQVAAAVL